MKQRLYPLGLLATLAALSACVIVPDGPLTGPNAVPGGPGAAAVDPASFGATSESKAAALEAALTDDQAAKMAAGLEGLAGETNDAAAAELFGQAYAPPGSLLEGAAKPKPRRTLTPKTGGVATAPSKAPTVVAKPVVTPPPKPLPTPKPTPTPAPAKRLISTVVAGSGLNWPTEFLVFGDIRPFDGLAGQNLVRNPHGVVHAGDGFFVFTDGYSGRIRYFIDNPNDPNNGFVGTFTRGGSGGADGSFEEAKFNDPYGLAVNAEGTKVVVADRGNNAIRLLDFNARTVTTIGGDSGVAGFADGDAFTSKFNQPTGVVFDGAGNVFVADNKNHRIRKIATDGRVTTLAGNGGTSRFDGQGTNAGVCFPKGITMDAEGTLYVAESSDSGVIRRITQDGKVSTVASGISAPSAVSVDAYGNLIYTTLDIANLSSGERVPVSEVYMITPEGKSLKVAGYSIGGNYIGAECLYLMPDGSRFYYGHANATSAIYRAEFK